MLIKHASADRERPHAALVNNAVVDITSSKCSQLCAHHAMERECPMPINQTEGQNHAGAFTMRQRSEEMLPVCFALTAVLLHDEKQQLKCVHGSHEGAIATVVRLCKRQKQKKR